MMRKHVQAIRFFILASSLIFCRCVKYTEKAAVVSPAYLRVFNSLTYQYGVFTKHLPSPFLVFLFDPTFDGQGIASGGQIVGDFLDTRDTLARSYPENAGNAGNLRNKDWPGSYGVLAAPPINGFDLSAWGQVPSGKHKILILGRPRNDTAFADLPPSARRSIVADTLIDFEPGGIYTLEAIRFDEVANKTGLYVRKESFTHRSFQNNQNYFSLYNLSAFNPQPLPGQVYPFIDSLNAYYSLFTTVCGSTGTGATPVYNCNFTEDSRVHDIYFRTVVGKFLGDAPFDSMPQPSSDNYFNPDGTYKNPFNRPVSIIELHPVGSNPLTNYKPSYLIFSDSYFTSTPYHLALTFGGLPISYLPGYSEVMPPLTVSTSNGQAIEPFHTVNIIEWINDRAFMIQVTQTFLPNTH